MEMVLLVLLLFTAVGVCIYMASSPVTLLPPSAPKWIDPDAHYRAWIKDQVAGPMTGTELIAMRAAGGLQANTLVAPADHDDWLAFDQYHQVQPEPSAPIPKPPSPAAAPVQASGFNLTKAGAILLGLGVLLSLALGVGLVEALLLASGIILLVIGLSRN